MVDLWPLTGRTEELRFISEALADDTQSGMVIAGPAGVGKTRLARAVADAAVQAGWTVRRVAGTATGRAVTLGAFARWADTTDASPLALAQKVIAGLAAEADGAKLLVLVDDAHALDDMSALIVHQLALQDTASVLATVRTGEPTPDAITALWKDSLLRRMDLQPLARIESDDLLQSVLGGPVSVDCMKRMWALSHGNVLFLHHLVEHERETGRLAHTDGEWRWAGTPSVSPSLVEVVEQQIGTVPDQVRDVVDLVAIAEPIDRAILATLAEPQAIEDAEQRGLIAATANAVYVGHPLYGEIRLSQCRPLRLRGLRGRVAGAMAQRDSVDPLRLGLLWLESDLPHDVEILSGAVNIASARLDLPLAERLAQAAYKAQPTPATTLQLAFILYLQEKGQAAEDLLATLETHELAAPGFVDGINLRAANLLLPLRNPERSRAVIDDALQLGDAERSHSLFVLRGVGHSMAAQPAETIEIMSAIDYDKLDDYGRILGYAAETIALGDLGRVEDATV
ncbi:MAG TPA: AAA family ATPase, partial [Mycobacterium sp.]